MYICTALAIGFAVSGCSGKNVSESSDGYSNSGNDNGSIKFVTKHISYSFPEFLEQTDRLGQFGRRIFVSFDKTLQSISDETATPDGFDCDAIYSEGKIFRFIVGDKYGLVSSEGKILFEAEYISLDLVRPGLFEFISADGVRTTGVLDTSGTVTISDDESYNWIYEENQLSIIQNSSVNPDAASDIPESVKYTITTPDGVNVYNALFDSVAVYPEIEQELDCAYAFSAHSGGYYYIITFDKYYNYTVFEGSYGSVEAHISDRSGSCDIFSYDHYMQLVSLLSSFKYTETELPDNLQDDFIAFTFGSRDLVSAHAKYYSDGYCVITLYGEEQTTAVYKISAEGFADAVDWVDIMLSTEYVTDDA